MEVRPVASHVSMLLGFRIRMLDRGARNEKVVGVTKPGDNDEYTSILEIHANVNLPGFEDEDELKLPYIVHMTEDDQKILCIRRNWDQEDPMRKKKMYFTHYTMIPGLGFYGYGYIHMVF